MDLDEGSQLREPIGPLWHHHAGPHNLPLRGQLPRVPHCSWLLVRHTTHPSAKWPSGGGGVLDLWWGRVRCQQRQWDWSSQRPLEVSALPVEQEKSPAFAPSL